MTLSIDSNLNSLHGFQPAQDPVSSRASDSLAAKPSDTSASGAIPNPNEQGNGASSVLQDLGELFGVVEGDLPGQSAGGSWGSISDVIQAIGGELVDWVRSELLGSDEASPSSSAASDSQDAASSSSNAGSAAPMSFEEIVSSLLSPGPDGQVNEEELFLAIVNERLETLVGEEAAGAFREQLAARITANTRADGYVPYEQLAVEALKELVSSGVLSAAQGDAVYAQAFAAAQLDDNADALFDGRGGQGDSTVAKAPFDQALASALSRIAAFDKGSEQAPAKKLAQAEATGSAPSARASGGRSAAGAALGGADGFLWKPVSESNGNLVILLPADMTGDAVEIVLRDANGDVLERARSSGVANGGREHFRFGRPGGDYPDGVTVEVRTREGSTKSYQIGETSQRHD